jgi:hypothetical protein
MKHILRRAVLATALLALTAGAAMAQSNDGHDRRVTIVNGSHEVMYSFFASSSASSDWGSDRLGNNVVQPGQSTIGDFDDGTGACLWDFRAVFSDASGNNQHPVEKRQINVCQISTYTYTDN